MDQLKEVFWPAVIAALGGAVDYLYAIKRGAVFSFSMLLLYMITSAFVGVICFWFATGSGISESWCAAAAGIGGLLGTRLIDISELALKKKLGIDK